MDFKKHLNMLKQPKVQSYIFIGSSIAFICIALCLLLSRDFWYYVDNISYYNSQYEYTSSMQWSYFGSHYSYIASQWKELYNKALFRIIFHVVGGVVFSVGGGIGLYRGLKKLKIANNSVDTVDDILTQEEAK